MKMLEVVEHDEVISVGKSNSYGVCKFKGGHGPCFWVPMNLQSVMLILHFNHCLINNLMTYIMNLN